MFYPAKSIYEFLILFLIKIDVAIYQLGPVEVYLTYKNKSDFTSSEIEWQSTSSS